MIYWDTSAILPLYVEEASSAYWESILTAMEGVPRGSQLAATEFGYALHHKLLQGALGPEAVVALAAKFATDCESGNWALCPLGSDVIAASLEILDHFQDLTNPLFLRSLDGLHLGAARVQGCDTVATGDLRMQRAAEGLGIRVLFPD